MNYLKDLSKKELKEKAKEIRFTLEEKGGVSPYCNLRSANESELIKFIEQCEIEIKEQELFSAKMARYKLEEEAKLKNLSVPSNIKTLSELGDFIVNTIAPLLEMKLSKWTKNGTLRIYNNSNNSYYLIDENGEVEIVGNKSLPELPSLLGKYENDLVKVEKPLLSKEEKIERYLDSQYGRGGWDSRDFIDAEEMECFQ